MIEKKEQIVKPQGERYIVYNLSNKKIDFILKKCIEYL